MRFSERITRRQKEKKSLVCVGLDPDLSRIPESVRTSLTPLFDFNTRIIDATSDIVCCYKPQFAHYAALGREKELEQTILYIKQKYPDIPVILDSKRGDVGNTARYYAMEAFDRYQADAVTLSPYLGFDAIEPFLEWNNKGLIILCKTSNPGSGMLQDIMAPDEKLFLKVAKAVASWSDKGDFALVVGATYPEIMKEIRTTVPALPFLVPGIGTQGGDLKATLEHGIKKPGDLILSSSRGIIHAGTGPDFDRKSREAAEKLNEDVKRNIPSHLYA
jgi:orotidine-5'-phosphate decarboxylase